MKRSSVRRFCFAIPLYGINVHVMAGGSPTSAMTRFGKLLGGTLERRDDWDSIDAYVAGEGPTLCVWFRDPIPRAHIVAHEAMHITSKVCLFAGIMGDYKNDEPMAYLLGHIVRSIGGRLWQ